MASRLRSGRASKISFFAFQDIITSVTGVLILVTLILTLYLNRLPDSLLSAAPAQDPALEQQLSQRLQTLTEVQQSNQVLQHRIAAALASPDPARLRAEIANLSNQVAAAAAELAGADAALDRETQAAARQESQLGLKQLAQLIRQTEIELEGHENAQATNTLRIQRLQQQLNQSESRLAQTEQRTNTVWLIPDTEGTSKKPLLVVVSASKLVGERFNDRSSRWEVPARDADERFTEALNRLNPAADYIVFYVRPSGIPLFERCRETAQDAEFDVGYDALEEQQEIVFSRPAGL